jgi:acetyl-CoA C-acetyltransferase
MMLDGLEDAYEQGVPMGEFGERAVQAYQFTRGDQDAYAVETLTRARKAITEGAFKAEIVPVSVPAKGGAQTIENDEHAMKVSPEKIPSLKPAFRADGTITAASASANADGAAALVLTTRSRAEREGLPILAEIKGHATHAQEPAWYTTAPIPAIRKVLEKSGWSVGDVDLFEINEAFAVVAMCAAKELAIPREKLNVHGGACALGHPIGATGARIIVTNCPFGDSRHRANRRSGRKRSARVGSGRAGRTDARAIPRRASCARSRPRNPRRHEAFRWHRPHATAAAHPRVRHRSGRALRARS